MSWEVEGSDVGYKSILILSEMVYVKPMHGDCFSLVSGSFSIRENVEEEMRQSKTGTAAPSLRCLRVIYSLGPRKK